MDSQQQPLDRYQSLTDAEIAEQLRAIHNGLLMRGRLETLIARRQIGELLYECARRYPRDRRRFEVFALRTVGLEYSDARRHIQLAVYWPRCLAALERLEAEARQNGSPMLVPGLRRLLTMAGVVGARPRAVPPDEIDDDIAEWLRPDGVLPTDIEGLHKLIRRLFAVERTLRGRIVILTTIWDARMNDCGCGGARVFGICRIAADMAG